MRFMRSCCMLCAASLVLSGCVCMAPKKPAPEKSMGINTSEVFRLGQEALKPIADRYITSSDRILLVPIKSRSDALAWRFAPVPASIPQDIYERDVKPKVSASFRVNADGSLGESAEIKQVSKAFIFDSGKKQYNFKPGFEGYDERLLGRALAAAGYSGYPPFSLTDFARLNPYFIDSLESGMLAAVLSRSARGFERLSRTDLDKSFRESHESGSMVFGTNLISESDWKNLREPKNQEPSTKMLMYSVNSLMMPEGSSSIGFTIEFKLVDMAAGGKILWSGSRTVVSNGFPSDKIPQLSSLSLNVPEGTASASRTVFTRAIRDQGVKTPINAVLVKIDDIPVFGTYPVTHEDFVVESALESFFGSIPGINIVDKLFKRQYKTSWQYTNAVFYINPFQGGDYREFQNYYGARYMIAYRVLWKDIQGIRSLSSVDAAELSPHVLGVYAKIIDMSARGRIVASHFIPIAGQDAINDNVLFRCYKRTSGFAALGQALGETALGATVNAVLVNRRMEIAGAYLDAESPASPSLPARFALATQEGTMRAVYDAYAVLDDIDSPPIKKEQASSSSGQGSSSSKSHVLSGTGELNLYAAINLMQSWFEDGLTTALVASGANLYEKLESLYSRALARQSDKSRDVFLSPLLLGTWGTAIKKYYNIDRIIYFSLMDTKTDSSRYYRVPEENLLARYFPVASYVPDSLQVSVVNTNSGDYVFKRDFPLE